MQLKVESDYRDLLNELNKKLTVSEKINFIHGATRQYCDFIHCISVAIYDAKTDLLKTFAQSSDYGNSLTNYQSKLREAKSLYRISLDRSPRVINDLLLFSNSGQEHSKRIIAHGYRSGYTVPMYQDEQLTGFVFFNSLVPNSFNEGRLPYLDVIARIISLIIGVELKQVQVLRGALKTATDLSSHKDPETGAHLERMARFARLIASKIAPLHGLNDEFVEAIFWFAPMHDVGKIAIPDHIVRKPAKLTSSEFDVMKTHTTRGREIVRTMITNFNLEECHFVSMIGNIAEFHHENMDGSGYPNGLMGEEIPIEARIIAVADVFDALTSERPHKAAWSNEEAFEELKKLSGWKLDVRCVEALIESQDGIVEIQRIFQDEQGSQSEVSTFPERLTEGAITRPRIPIPKY